MNFLRTWRYWLKRGHSLRYAWHLAKNTVSDNYLQTRRKRVFSFPAFWTKL